MPQQPSLLFSETLEKLLAGDSLSIEQMREIMLLIMKGVIEDTQIAGFLIALRMKPESIDEMTGAVQVLREMMTPVTINAPDAIDIVGTGGDKANLFNVSTAASFVVAASGVMVAKHGNHSVSSRSGAADLMTALGVPLDLTPSQIARCIQEVGIGFMFAPQHHSAMRHVVKARKQLKVRTLFNLLGPLCNPASVGRQLLGLYERRWLLPVAQVLQRLGSKQVMLVHSEDGLDEISIAAPTHIVELRDNDLHQYQITPEQVGLRSQSLDALVATDSSHSLSIIRQALKQQNAAAMDMLLLNAGAAIYVSGHCASLEQGMALAEDSIATGLALEKMRELVSFTEMLTLAAGSKN